MTATSAVGNYETSSALPISWLGLSAVYTVEERQLMAALPVVEQTVLHALKSLTAGTLCSQNHDIHNECEYGETVNIYTNPEDIPFGETGTESNSAKSSGKTTKKRPIYAVVWTPSRSRVVRTKSIGTRKMRAWKRWYERRGWKVVNHATGYFARSPQGELHAILLHEYDRETKERLA